MSPRIVGPSGVELEVDVEMARGLVRDGFAKLVDGDTDALLNRVDKTVVLNPEGSPAVVYPVGNSVSDVVPNKDLDASTDGRPRGNASREEWAAYALANGKTEDDINGLKQGEIRALFADPADGEGGAGGGDQPPASDTPPVTDGDDHSEE
jgi:hypothetical protein